MGHFPKEKPQGVRKGQGGSRGRIRKGSPLDLEKARRKRMEKNGLRGLERKKNARNRGGGKGRNGPVQKNGSTRRQGKEDQV